MRNRDAFTGWPGDIASLALLAGLFLVAQGLRRRDPTDGRRVAPWALASLALLALIPFGWVRESLLVGPDSYAESPFAALSPTELVILLVISWSILAVFFWLLIDLGPSRRDGRIYLPLVPLLGLVGIVLIGDLGRLWLALGDPWDMPEVLIPVVHHLAALLMGTAWYLAEARPSAGWTTPAQVGLPPDSR